MEEITVINTGNRVRIRAGHRFEPGKEMTLEVPPSAKRAIRATADLQITSADGGAESDTDQQQSTVDVSEMTVKQVLAALETHELEPGFVYQQEREGKQRASILEVVAPNEGPDTSTPDDGTGGND